jgi:hypothetical protein
MTMRVLAGIWRILTLTCDEATRLMSRRLDEPLPWPQRAAVRLHALICPACRRFLRQIRFLRAAVRRLGSEATALRGPLRAAPGRLSAAARLRIEDSIRRARDENDC